MKTIQIISIIRNILTFIIMFYSIYHVTFWFFAYIKPIKKEKITNKKHKFMAIVSARNEEKVIANLIESLKEQNYPEDKLDIYVIADNCTDKTADISRKAGAIVYERFDETRKSKGYALEWFFDKVMEEFPDKYDAFCVFDADNIVDPNFISVMNDKLCEGETIVQGYRDVKNPGDNWISANNALYYWMLNRLYHYSRYKLGFSSFVQGTGFMVSMDIIREENGWHTTALTEDIEFSFTQIGKGRKVAWANDAIIYDEQTTSFMQAWNQRLRWGAGHVQCMRKCLPRIMKTEKITPTIVDAFLYLAGYTVMFMSLVCSILNFVLMSAMTTRELYHEINIQFIMTMTFIFGSILQIVVLLLLEKRSLRQVWKGIITYPIFLGFTYIVNLCAVFNTNMAWKPIEHVKAIKLSEIEK